MSVVPLRRRHWLARAAAGAGALVLLGGCGFKLRGQEHFVFQSITVQPQPGGALAGELRAALARAVPAGATLDAKAAVVLELMQEQREKVVVNRSAAGQVREFQLRIKAVFRLRGSTGVDLIEATEITQYRDVSFNESAVLAKESEEALLYRDMQRDIVQQIMRRLAALDHL